MDLQAQSAGGNTPMQLSAFQAGKTGNRFVMPECSNNKVVSANNKRQFRFPGTQIGGFRVSHGMIASAAETLAKRIKEPKVVGREERTSKPVVVPYMHGVSHNFMSAAKRTWCEGCVLSSKKAGQLMPED